MVTGQGLSAIEGGESEEGRGPAGQTGRRQGDRVRVSGLRVSARHRSADRVPAHGGWGPAGALTRLNYTNSTLPDAVAEIAGTAYCGRFSRSARSFARPLAALFSRRRDRLITGTAISSIRIISFSA